MAEPFPEAETRAQAMQSTNGWFDSLSRPWILCLLMAIVTLATFWQVIGHGFINYDDPTYFAGNPRVLRGLTWSNVLWALRTTDNASWYPLTWLSYLLDATLFGKGATGPHFTNLLIHMANTILVFLVLRRLTAAHWRSAIVAALFALHPLHVESVAWISERKGLLSTFFGLLTLWAYIKYVECESCGAATTDASVAPTVINGKSPCAPGRARYYGLALALFACSLMSKPALVALPCAMLLLDYWPLARLKHRPQNHAGKYTLRLVAEKLPFLFFSLASSVVTIFVHKQSGALTALETVPFGIRIEAAFVSYARYLEKTIWPVRLALPYPDPGKWRLNEVMLALMLVIGVNLVAMCWWRRRPYALVGWFWFLIMLFPVIGLIGWGSHTMADRFTYVPSIGIFLVVVWTAAEFIGNNQFRKRWGIAAAVLMLGACAVRTENQLRHWKNSETLFRHSLAVTENNIVALDHLGIRLSFEGRFDEALKCFHEALRLNPRGSQVLYDLGNCLAAQGRLDDAVANFEAAIQIMPEHYDAHNNLGQVLAMQGKLVAAAGHYQQALKYSPDNASLHKKLAQVLGAEGKVDEAIAQYRLALMTEPEDADAQYALGIALAVRGNWDEAIQHYAAAVRLSPTNAEAFYNLGYALRVIGRSDEAAKQLKAALRLKPEFPLAHYNLGCVLIESGKIEEAATHLREALRLKPDYHEARQKLDELAPGK